MCDEPRPPERDGPNREQAGPPESHPPASFDDAWAEMTLRQALRGMDVPEPSRDFDMKVLASVRGRSLWWDLFLSYLRPALATAAGATVVTLLLVHWVTRPPKPVVASGGPAAGHPAAAVMTDTPSGPAAPGAGAPTPETDRVLRTLDTGRPTYAGLMSLRDAARADGEPDKTETGKEEPASTSPDGPEAGPAEPR